MRPLTTWEKELKITMADKGESLEDIVSNTLTPEQMIREFNDGFGGSEGHPFTVWTKKRVYFPVVYDGSEWVESVPRDPNGEPTIHVGGE